MRKRREEMSAVLNAFLRCVAFLLPPSWLQFCWWVGEASWPNPRARFKHTKPLTYEEVAAQDEPKPVPSSSSDSSAPSPSPWRRFWTLWSAVERVLSAPFDLHTRLGSLCSPYRVAAGSPSSADASGAAEEEAFTAQTMSSSTEQPDAEPREISAPVTITVAIQAAEDEEPDEEPSCSTIELQTGSGSEDEIGRHDKSRPASALLWSTNESADAAIVLRSSGWIVTGRFLCFKGFPAVSESCSKRRSLPELV
ncbi:hypothetical protein cypCar_00040632 [Cyprinus carpio]|nr:hypothetical protein cypCar_00040632 [Cyprinus carpio]